MNCNFIVDVQKAETPMKIEAQEIPQKRFILYLGSKISEDGDIEHYA